MTKKDLFMEILQAATAGAVVGLIVAAVSILGWMLIQVVIGSFA